MTLNYVQISNDGSRTRFSFCLFLGFILAVLFTPQGVSLADETELNTKKQDTGNISTGKKKRSHRGRVRNAQLPDEFLLERFFQNVTGERDKTWSSTQPACQWKDVACSKEGRVTGIYWNTEKLQGAPYWENLPSTVEHLYLQSSSDKQSYLGGTLDLSVLPRGLKTFYLAGNSFQGPLDLTALPPHLETATFFGNNFSGSLDLTRLPSPLKRLKLSYNKFKGLVDLTSLPEEMIVLFLDHNQLSGAISLKKLPNTLNQLFLNDNQLTGVVDLQPLFDSHYGASRVSLRLENNAFSGYYPKGIVLTRASYKPPNTLLSHVRTGTNPIAQGPGPTSITQRRKSTSAGGKTSRPSDAVLLERFFQNVTGERDKTWSSTHPACQWKDVACSKEGRVTGIYWNTEKLQGAPYWENLPSTVEHLYLQNPSDKQSYLGGTLDLSVLPRGLKTFYLAGNSFQGPLDLTALPPHLEQADFSGNNFSGSLDLTRLPSTLKWIELSFNSFSGPLDLTQLPEGMTDLYLSKNHLHGSISLDQLPRSLRRLSLYTNSLSGPLDLTQLPEYMRDLFLDNNQFNGEISLQNLPPPLSRLTLQNNRFSGVLDLHPLLDSSTKESKMELRLEGNAFSGYLPEGKLPMGIVYGTQHVLPSRVESSEETDETLTETTEEASSATGEEFLTSMPCQIA